MAARSPRRRLDPRENLHDLAAVMLDRIRLERNLSQADLAEKLRVHRSTIAPLVSGETAIQMRHARRADEIFHMGGVMEAIVHQAETHHDTSWGNERVKLQAKADDLAIWEVTWVPGILQTPGYAEATALAAGKRDPEQRAASVARRMAQRVEVLDKPNPPRLRILLDQGVIEQPVGGAAVMAEQLAELLALSELYSIRVVPRKAGAHIGRNGSFWIMEVDSSPIVFAEAPGPGRLVRAATEVKEYRVWLDWISDVALPRADSAEMIRRTMEKFRDLAQEQP